MRFHQTRPASLAQMHSTTHQPMKQVWHLAATKMAAFFSPRGGIDAAERIQAKSLPNHFLETLHRQHSLPQAEAGSILQGWIPQLPSSQLPSSQFQN